MAVAGLSSPRRIGRPGPVGTNATYSKLIGPHRMAIIIASCAATDAESFNGGCNFSLWWYGETNSPLSRPLGLTGRPFHLDRASLGSTTKPELEGFPSDRCHSGPQNSKLIQRFALP